MGRKGGRKVCSSYLHHLIIPNTTCITYRGGYLKKEVVGEVFTNEMICNARMFEFALNENVWHDTDRKGNICPLVYIVFIYYACLFYNPDAQGNVAERKYFLLLKNDFEGDADEAQQLIDGGLTPAPISGGTAGPITPRTFEKVSKLKPCDVLCFW